MELGSAILLSVLLWAGAQGAPSAEAAQDQPQPEVSSDSVSRPAFETPEQAFARAESAYQDGDFTQAADIYRSILEQGLDDGTLYYNLGNAYFKAGRLGLAILNYERALLRMPSDADTRANLAFANELIADAVERAPMPLVIDWLVRWYQGLSAHGVSMALSIFSLLAGVASITWRLAKAMKPSYRRLAGWIALSALAVSFVAGATLLSKLWLESGRVDAVVLGESSTVRSGPGANNPQLAEIHEGLKVRVLSQRTDWYQIALPNGLTGWIRETELEAI